MGTTIRTMDSNLAIGSNRRLLVIILPSVLGTLILLTVTLTILNTTRRRLRLKAHFGQAQLRDPGLTWEEFERRGALTRSRLVLEEELLRNAMIRKTQQSRQSQSGGKEAADEQQQQQEAADASVRPARTRSKTWHGRTGGLDVDVEDGRQLLQEELEGVDWGSAQASVERTWQLLHGKKYPSLEGKRLLLCEDDGGVPRRPPTVRLKTPPILSHPVFQDSVGQVPPKHLSLPTELIRVRTEPGTFNKPAEMQISE